MSAVPEISAAAPYRSFSPRRVGAMVLRYWYLLRYSWPRIVDLIYWPAVQMLMWGFLQLYIDRGPSGFVAGRRRIHRRGAPLGHPVPRPDRLLHLVPGGAVVAQPRQPHDDAAPPCGARRGADGDERHPRPHRARAGQLLAIVFFGFNFWRSGSPSSPFFFNLILTSWSIGLISRGMVLKKGLGAEALAWT